MRKKTKIAKKRTRLTSDRKKRPNLEPKPKARGCEYPLPINYLLEEHPEL